MTGYPWRETMPKGIDWQERVWREVREEVGAYVKWSREVEISRGHKDKDCKGRRGWDGMCVSFLRTAMNKVPNTGGPEQQFWKLEVEIKVPAVLLPP